MVRWGTRVETLSGIKKEGVRFSHIENACPVNGEHRSQAKIYMIKNLKLQSVSRKLPSLFFPFLPPLQIPLLLLRINMPHDIIRQSHDTIARAIRHGRETLGISLVLESVAREIDAGSVHIGFDQDVDAADAVEVDFLFGILVPVAHPI